MAIHWSALKQSQLFFLGIGLAACSIIIGILGLSYKHLNERFASEGVTTEGLVLAKEKENNPDRDPRYLVEFSFADTQGKTVRAKDAVPEKVWDTLNVNEKAPIAFLRSEPMKARIASPSNKEDGKVQFWFAGIGGILAVVSFVWAFVRLARSQPAV